jgi:hypothetical protein
MLIFLNKQLKMNLAKMADGGIGSDEFVNFKCWLCEKKHITKQADTCCVKCQDYYCTQYTNWHRFFPEKDQHQFINKPSFNTANSDARYVLCRSQ